MKRISNIPQGYKNGPLGIIPEEWKTVCFEDIAHIDKDSLTAKTPVDYEFDYVSLSDVDSEDFKIETTRQAFKTAPSRARRIVNKGDILLSTVRPNLQGFSIIKNDVKNLIASTGFAVLTAKTCDNRYLFQYLFCSLMSRQFYQLLVGSNYPAINSSDVRKLKIPLPPLPEQQKIAEILSVWDEAIEKQTQLIAQLETRKCGLMQQLLTEKVRAKGYENTRWERKSLSQCMEYTPREVPKPESSFFALGVRSHGKGIFYKNNFDPEDLAMNILYEVKENDFVVNITFAWEHAVAIANAKDDGGLVSHRFPTYTFKTKAANPIFFKYYILQKRFKHELELISPGGAGRNRVMSKKDLLNIVVLIPKVDEQLAIAGILSKADLEINLTKQKLATLKEQKKGLMQQLLTGKKRVKI